MSLRFHLGEDFLNATIGADQEGGAFNAHEFAAVERFFLPDAVRLADLARFIKKEREIQLVFFTELRECSGAFLLRLTPSGMLLCSARGVAKSRKSQASCVQPGVIALG